MLNTLREISCKRIYFPPENKVEIYLCPYINNPQIYTVFLTETERKTWSEIKHEKRKLEWLTSRILLKNIFEDQEIELVKDHNNKPLHIHNQCIGVSHSGSKSAIGISDTLIGIDLQIEAHEKCKAVFKKFGMADEIEKLSHLKFDPYTLLWSAKESVFKYFGHSLPFLNITLSDIYKQQMFFEVQRGGKEHFRVDFIIDDLYCICIAHQI